MPFIGTQPEVGGYSVLDALTASATASYTLQLNSANFVPSSANQLLVSLNGVIQKPGSSFTVSGSTLTFSSALTSSDSIDFIISMGEPLLIGTPSDNTVTTNKLVNDSVTGAKIENNPTIAGNLTVSGTSTNTGLITASAGVAVGGTGSENTLDDYEEGDWTPVLKFGGGTTGITYNAQIGRYTKVGRQVFINATVFLSSKGSSTGVAQITGLPFATGGTQFTAATYDDRISGGATRIQLYNNGNGTELQFFESDDDQSNNSQLQQDSFANNAFILVQMHYFVS